jgi:release factor glutamine methyltransferase
MTIAQWLLHIRKALIDAGIPEDEAETESELILRDALGLDRVQLHLRAMEQVEVCVAEKLESFVSRRARGEPLAYIFGHWPFFGLDFIISPHVLIPRPETEGLVEMAIGFCRQLEVKSVRAKVADVGTGSGVIAVTLAKECNLQHVLAIDSSTQALDVAKKNVEKHALAGKVKVMEGDLLGPAKVPLHLIVGNLPYIPTNRLPGLQPEVQWEPRHALDGGPDGLDVIKRLLVQARGKLASGGIILLEIDDGQGEALKDFSAGVFPKPRVSVEKDLSGLSRYFMLESP